MPFCLYEEQQELYVNSILLNKTVKSLCKRECLPDCEFVEYNYEVTTGKIPAFSDIRLDNHRLISNSIYKKKTVFLPFSSLLSLIEIRTSMAFTVLVQYSREHDLLRDKGL